MKTWGEKHTEKDQDVVVLVGSKGCWGLPRWHRGKEAAYQCRRCKRGGFDLWIQKIPWRRKQQPIPVFLPGKFHGQWSLVGYSPWVSKSQTRLSMNIRSHQVDGGYLKKWNLSLTQKGFNPKWHSFLGGEGVVFVFSKGIQHSTAKWLVFDSLYLQLLQPKTKTKLQIHRLYVVGMNAR